MSESNGSETNNRVTHIAIKVSDIDASLPYYQTVFGYHVVSRRWHDGHVSCHLGGAGINLTLIQYDSEDTPEALYSGTGPTIHHIGIEVDDIPGTIEKLKAAGCTVLSAPGAIPVKYRAPDGTIAELQPAGVAAERR